MLYLIKTTFCDPIVGTAYKNNIIELADNVAHQYLVRKYITPYVVKPRVIKPEPIADAESRIKKVVMPDEPECCQDLKEKKKRRYTRRRKA